MILGIPKPVIAALSVNGPQRTKLDHPDLPYSTEELGILATSARKQGASMMRLSVRDEKGRHSFDPELNISTISSLRDVAEGQLLLQMDGSCLDAYGIDEVEKALLAAKPDACLMPMTDLLPRTAEEEDEDRAKRFFNNCAQAGIGVQLAMSDPSDIDWYYAFLQYGIIPEDCKALHFTLGEDGDPAMSSPHQLRPFLAALDKHNLTGKVVWTVSAFGVQEAQALTAAIALGGHMAPGFAYNCHNSDGEMAAHQMDQLALLCDLAERLGRPTANRLEAKTLLFGVS